MKLLVLAEDFYPNTSGGAHVRWRFCELAVERGHDVTVFTTRDDGTARSEVVDGVEIRRPFGAVPPGVPVYHPVAVVTRALSTVLLLGAILWWLRDEEVDGVHSASHLTHWLGAVVSRARRVPYVNFVGLTPSSRPEPPRSFKYLLEQLNFGLFMGDVVFCREPRVREALARRVDGDVRLLHGCLHTDRIERAAASAAPAAIREEFGVGPDERLLAYVGRLSPLKRPTAAVDVVAELPPHASLVVVGDGDERERVVERVRRRGLGDRVRLAGRRPHEETLRIIAASDALVVTSEHEAYPTVVFEALALGSRVFAPPVGILPTVDHGRLHLGSVDELPALIEATDGRPTAALDRPTLERFSLARYTDDLLGAFAADPVADPAEP